MTDIVGRLREDQPGERHRHREARCDLGWLLDEAAAEIEQLRAARNEAIRQMSKAAQLAGWFQGAAPGIIAALETCADDLESEVSARYPEPIHPSQAGRRRRDLEPIAEARRMVKLLQVRMKDGG